MNRKMIEKLVLKEIRRALKPTGLLGKRGPAKNVPVMVKREIDAAPRSCSIVSHRLVLAIGGSQ